jgi:hypothetical protein
VEGFVSSGFVKLYETILDSSIWGEGHGTRLVWITMLAMADENGVVIASAGGLARRANVSREELADALAVLSAPDPDSKSPEFEGRRIERVDGGWLVLNHRRYRDMRSSRQIATAKRVAEHRAKVTAQRSAGPVTGNNVTPGNEGESKASASASASASESGSDLDRGTGGKADQSAPTPPSEPGPPSSSWTEEPSTPLPLLATRAKLWVSDAFGASHTGPGPWTWREVLEVAAHFDEIFPGVPTRFSDWRDPRLRKVVERFADGCTAFDLCLVIDGAALDEHISSHPEFHSLTTILRDAGQVDRFTRLAKAGPRKLEKVRNAGSALLDRARSMAEKERAASAVGGDK